MECDELVQYLSDYIDQGLTEDLRKDAEEHLTTCRNCRVVLDTTQQMIFLYREAGRRVIPAQRRKALFDRLQEAFNKRNEIDM